jgi:hypothetical protein
MADQLDFEAALERRLQARASMAQRPFDASSVAAAAVVARPARRLALPWTFHGLAWGWVAVLLATLAIAGGTVLAGALLRDWYQGPWLAYTSTDGLYLAHEDGTRPRRIFASGNQLRFASWSADGSLIAVVEEVVSDNVANGRTLVVDRDGRVVWSIEGNPQAVWSHHGHRLAWMSGGTSLMVTDIDTGAASTWLAGSPDTMAGNPAWSPDDTRIALNWYQDASGANLRIVAEDRSFRDLLEAQSWMAPRWSPDGRLISVVTRDDTICGQASDGSCPSDIVIVDAATGTQVDGIRDLNWVMGVVWSPDGTRLAWDMIDLAARQENFFVGTLPLSGGEPVQVTDWPGSTWLIGWSGDSRSLLAEHIVWPENATGPQLVELWRIPVDPAEGDPVMLRDDVIWAALQPAP